MIEKIKKGDGTVVDFDKEKITNAIFKAAEAVGGQDKNLAKELANRVTRELQIKTINGGDLHFCSWSKEEDQDKYPIFEDGTDRIHKVPIYITEGRNKIFVECTDETGGSTKGLTSLKMIKDSSEPQIARVWQDSGKLYVTTNEPAECKYSTDWCGFNWTQADSMGSNLDHKTSVTKGKTYYIKCEDEFGNIPSGCSMEVRAV